MFFNMKILEIVSFLEDDACFMNILRENVCDFERKVSAFRENRSDLVERFATRNA